MNNNDLFSKYRHEINKIDNLLLDLEKAKVYEADRVPGVPRCSTLAGQIKSELYELLDKIQNNEDGFTESVSKKLSKARGEINEYKR